MGMPKSGPAAAAGIAAGSLATFPVWAASTDLADAGLLLARIPGGKNTKEQNKIVPAPEEDGFSDAQVAFALCLGGIALWLALDVLQGLRRGLRPVNKDKKGRITPLVKRFIEM